MNKKITFGKIKLNTSKASEETADGPSTQGKWKIMKIFKQTMLRTVRLLTIYVSGFGTFGKVNQSEEIDDVETQHVKNIMGISAFGRKAKSFDITVSGYFAP